MTVEIGALLEIDTKSLSDTGEFEGYASIFDKKDFGRDVVRPGAFTKSLLMTPASRVKMLRGHDTAEPIGLWTDIAEDTRGLHAKGRLIMEVGRARETHALMKAGVLDGLSIGYRTKRDSFDRLKGIRYLDEVDLKEISVVTFPMMGDAVVTSVKHDTGRAREIVAAIHRASAALRSA